MKLDRDTAEALVRLSHTADFQKVMEWLDIVQQTFVQGAVMGHDENYSPDVLRGRAQGITILRGEMEKAPEVAVQVQKVS